MAFNQIPPELYLNYILPHAVRKPMKLLDWIDINKLDWWELSGNPNVIDLLIKYHKNKRNISDNHRLNWSRLSLNPNIIDILIEYFNGAPVYWQGLSYNKSEKARDILKANPDKINWECLVRNDSAWAIELIKSEIIANPSKIGKYHWRFLSENTSKEAIELLKSNQDKIDWIYLSINPSDYAIELIKSALISNNKKKEISWSLLSLNPSDGAIEILKANPNKIVWDNISRNPNPGAIELITKHLISNPNKNKIDWSEVARNESIDAMEILTKQLISNPNNIDWTWLSRNPYAIDILKANKHKIHWGFLSSNPSIFEFDYKKWDELMIEYCERFIYTN